MTEIHRPSPLRIYVHPATEHSSGDYRMRMPAWALRKAGLATVMCDMRLPDVSVMKTLAPDVIVLQHPYTQAQEKQIRTYRQNLKDVALVYEIDDVLWDLNPDNPRAALFPPDLKLRMASMLRLFDRIVAATPELSRRLIKDFGLAQNRVFVRENLLPDWFLTAADAGRPIYTEEGRTRLRVGWAGGDSHRADLEFLKPIVEATLDRYQWVFMGSAPDGLQNQVEFHPAVPLKDYPAALAALDLDVAAAPLLDTAFNRCKSDLRILEYGACGYGVLASLVRPFENLSGKVWYANNTVEDWRGALDSIQNNPQSRKALGECANALRDHVREYRTFDEFNLQAWSEAWSDRKGSFFSPQPLPFKTESPSLVVVGEPFRVPEDHIETAPCFATIAEAHATWPRANVLYLRPGTVPTLEQVSLAVHLLDGQDSVSSLSNDGDYPVPGRFVPLPGAIADEMRTAALNGNQGTTIPVPYPGGPMILVSSAALAQKGLPDEARYNGDIETALLEWSMRGEPGRHIIASELYVPVAAPYGSQKNRESMVQEIVTWHQDLPARQQAAAENPLHAESRRNLDLAFHGSAYLSPPAGSYAEWTAMHDAWTSSHVEWAAKEQATWINAPLVSVILPAYNSDPVLLRKAVDSIVSQSYDRWELIVIDDASSAPITLEGVDPRINIIRRETNGHISAASNTGLDAAKGEWVLFLDHDDEMPPYALHMLVREVVARPETAFVYGDSDLIAPDGSKISPFFKPEFDYDLLLAENYVCHPAMYRLEQVRAINGFRVGFEGSQDYDLFLRYMEHSCAYGAGVSGGTRFGDFSRLVKHVPMVLYHWRQAPGSVALSIASKPYAIQAAHRAVLEHLNRIGRNAFIGPHPAAPLHHLIRFAPPVNEPPVQIIILTERDAKGLTRCLGSLLERTTYGNYSVLVRQGGDDKEVSAAIARFTKASTKIRHIRGAAMRPFNFSLLCNRAAESAPEGSLLVFLNDDVEILENAWLSDMVGIALRPDVGAVGVRLIYPTGHVQHNGILWNPEAPAGEACLHAFRGLPHENPGPFAFAAIAHQTMAVTGACLCIRRDLFLWNDGFDEAAFPLDFGDVDLCLRLHRKGFRNIVLSHIILSHAEGATKQAVGAVNRSTLLRAEEKLRLRHADLTDCTFNANLDYEPSRGRLASAPPRPWLLHSDRPSFLLIGGTMDEAKDLYASGGRPFLAEPVGNFLRLSMPVMHNVAPIDMREPDILVETMDRLGLDRILLRRLGQGSTDILGALAYLASKGVPIDHWQGDFAAVCPRLLCTNSLGACQHEWKNGVQGCQACVDRDGSQHGRISVASYRAAWAHLHNAIVAQQEAGKKDSVIAC